MRVISTGHLGRFLRVAAFLAFALTMLPLARANDPLFTLWDFVGASGVIFTGKVTNADQPVSAGPVFDRTVSGPGRATLAVSEVLSGTLDAKEISVTSIYIVGDTGSLNSALMEGQEVLVFGQKSDAGQITIIEHGWGRAILTPANKIAVLAATRRFIAIAALPGDTSKIEAMLALLADENSHLRFASRSYLLNKFRDAAVRDQNKALLLALLNDPDPLRHDLALSALPNAHWPEALPRLLEFARGTDYNEIMLASRMLAHDAHPEAIAALAILTLNPDPRVRLLASGEMAWARNPEFKNAQLRLLSDPDPKVRAAAARWFANFLKSEPSKDVMPKLTTLLEDPDSKVQAAAVAALESARPARRPGYIRPPRDGTP